MPIALHSSTKTGVWDMATQLFEGQTSQIERRTVDRRRFQRIRLQIPLFIRGTDPQGNEFLELAKTLDISAGGARLISPKAMQSQETISLTIPAPLPRSAEFGECGTPPILARIRRLEAYGEMKMAAVEFLRPLE
jgi:c-di-GMP-binding flagellar brake protein YcgR